MALPLLELSGKSDRAGMLRKNKVFTLLKCMAKALLPEIIQKVH